MNSSLQLSVTSSHRRRFAGLVFSVFTALVFAGCANSIRFETSGGGHQIIAKVEGSPLIDSRATHATISSAFGGVTIERDRARIDQGPWQKIPENVPVETSISKHTVSIHAGRVSISRTVN